MVSKIVAARKAAGVTSTLHVRANVGFVVAIHMASTSNQCDRFYVEHASGGT